MGIIFTSTVRGKNKAIADMGNTRAKRFIHFTEYVCQEFDMNADDVLFFEKHGSDECWVEPDKFCALVERVVRTSNPNFYDWASWAAGMYEMIVEGQCGWEWERSTLPVVPFTPRQSGVEGPTTRGNRIIGYQSRFIDLPKQDYTS